MATIRRQGGLYVAAAAVALVLLSTTTTTTVSSGALQVEAKSLQVDPLAVSSLRGGKRTYAQSRLRDRGLEEGQEGENNENENHEEEGQEQENEEEEHQEEEAEGEQQQQQQENEEEEEEEEQGQQQQQNNYEQQQEEYDEAEYEYGNDDGYSNQIVDDDAASGQVNVTEMVDNVKTSVSDLMDRFDYDVANMWSTSPAEWDEEYWKVFGIIGGIFTVLLSCIIYICCLCCCGGGDPHGKDVLVATESEAEQHRRGRSRRTHRGRRFLSMSRSDGSDTMGDDTTEHTRRSDGSEEWESPFALIEDADGNDDSASNRLQLTSPVYARGSNDAGDFDGALSPLSSKTLRSASLVRTKGSKTSTRSARKTPTVSIAENDNESQNNGAQSKIETGDTLKTTSSVLKEPSGGIINETVDVWSEFLGFKKSKYNIPPVAQVNQEEDEDINLTDDEKTKRASRSRGSSMSVSSSKKKVRSQSSGALSRTGHQMRTGTYTKPSESISDPEVVVPAAATYSAETPIVSNSGCSNSARQTKSNSPRRIAYIKTKNLLKSFGGNKTRGVSRKPPLINTSPDPKEESLLNDNDLTPAPEGQSLD
mmetsp:Transcript_10359/g.24679  ORF Transcript_10359/g.24679 Transcript_10359/m.24679 type:complete len:592 (-) Transcript_10359:293-2068(-)